ncbi:hypothetical protein QTP70_005532 [Hemibagrus guttatus]|uniref:ribonuclease H n=1 Tax=Hemibagrus guttatus TaxID=175788 RepID=A0AAE0QBY6_9TELE|nr:hypothetical protein QTP70_005532 [Hemibagrus guttatus]
MHIFSVMAAEGIPRADTRLLLALVVPQLKSFGISEHSGATGMSYSEARGCAVVLLQGMLYCSCDWNGVSDFKEIGKGSGIASWTDQSAMECSNLEKAYDRVPREELWYCMRKSGVAEKYVRVVQDMYERSRTVVRCAVGQTEEFKVEVGVHQGSALSPFLFAMVMDQLSEEVRQESPCTMVFADDIVICSDSREQVEENLER